MPTLIPTAPVPAAFSEPVTLKPPDAAAAADALRDDRAGFIAVSRGDARQLRIDPQRRSAGAARAAKANADIAARSAPEIESAGDVEGARAAAAADRLGDEAGRLIAMSGDRFSAGVDPIGIAATAARSAKANANRAARDAADRQIAVDVERARAAAAAGRLDEDAARLVAQRLDGVIDVAGDRIARAAAAARTAEADRNAERRRSAESQIAADVEAARTAAAADRLDDHAVGLVAMGQDGAVGRTDDHAAGTRAAARSAKADRDSARESARGLDIAADIIAARSAAAADRLDNDAGRAIARGLDIAADCRR